MRREIKAINHIIFMKNVYRQMIETVFLWTEDLVKLLKSTWMIDLACDTVTSISSHSVFLIQYIFVIFSRSNSLMWILRFISFLYCTSHDILSQKSLWALYSSSLTPSFSFFQKILATSITTVVGYFVTFLMTKTLSGLPIKLLRIGSLLRFFFLNLIFKQSLLTQRELDEVYKPESLLSGL